jgi:hypothetical protein
MSLYVKLQSCSTMAAAAEQQQRQPLLSSSQQLGNSSSHSGALRFKMICSAYDCDCCAVPAGFCVASRCLAPWMWLGLPGMTMPVRGCGAATLTEWVLAQAQQQQQPAA